MKEIIEIIEKSNVGRVDKDVPLSKHTTYKVGGKAKVMVYPRNTECLIKLMKIIKNNNVKYKVLGKGSNLLFSDDIFDGVIVKLDELNNVDFFGKNKIRVGAGFSLMKLSMLAAKRGLAGLEFASGIPGTVGGAVFMNAGAYKSDMGYVVTEIKVLTPDLKIITLENKELQFHYRSSFLQTHQDYICLETVIKLMPGDKSVLDDVIKERRKRRMESQPLEYPSAGSVFRNPDGMFAGKLIEDLGLKGKTIGGAKVSEKHANFIVNYRKASSADIKNLIELVHDKVLDEYKVDMKVEQEFVNWE